MPRVPEEFRGHPAKFGSAPGWYRAYCTYVPATGSSADFLVDLGFGQYSSVSLELGVSVALSPVEELLQFKHCLIATTRSPSWGGRYTARVLFHVEGERWNGLAERLREAKDA